ncbi:M48 family metallopeptidase [Aestuariibacter salexigens]|uniref:M48 family metallopeptidase n=1 Tax=Aestuariibacter salexigens TaxID=226010 RepID=UPI000420B3B0|nr:M48 family metallopeptidase [Aestuariibacter salexigens]
MRSTLRTVAITFLSVFLLSSCATSPTGRSQLLLYSSQELSVMGAQAFDGMKTQLKVTEGGQQNSYVNCVAGFITRQVPQSVFAGQWEVVVFDDEQVNAFALPGGKIGVYTGLLKVATNQHQLAAVIGHEVGHVIAEHGNERMSQGTLIQIGTEATRQIINANEVAYSQPIMAAIGLGLQVGVQLPFSRTHESEADLIGLDLMASSGFDPQQAVSLWQNMEKASGGRQQPEFLSTHPAPQTRIKDLQANMQPAMALYKASTERPRCNP